MTDDPEADSLANMGTFRAIRSWDESKNVPIERWIALVVKQEVWCYWRQLARRKETTKSETWWSEVFTVDDQEPEYEIAQADLQLLTEYYVEKWPLDVVAKRHPEIGSVHYVKKAINAAVSRLQEAARGERVE